MIAVWMSTHFAIIHLYSFYQLRMRKELKNASGFGATMMAIDLVAKRLNETLDNEQQK